jgi:hypothetical protein
VRPLQGEGGEALAVTLAKLEDVWASCVERALCKTVLDALVADKVLCVKSGGTHARLTEGIISRPRPVKADLRAKQRVASAS